jgi:hypothetical protein
MAAAKKLLNSVEYTVQHHDGEEFQLKGFRAIKNYFETELKFWQNIKNPQGLVQGIIARLSQVVAAIDTLEAQTNRDEGQFPTNKQNMIAQLDANLGRGKPRNQVIYSSKPEAQLVKDLHTVSPSQADAAFQYFMRQPPNIANREVLIGTLRAYEFDRQSESLIANRAKVEKRTLGKLRSEWNETRTTLIKEHSEFTENHETWRDEFTAGIDSWQEEKEDAVKKLESLYGEKLHLEAPVQYWEDRAADYRKYGMLWLVSAGVIISVMIYMLLSILYDMPLAFTKSLLQGDPLAIRGIIIFATIISFSAYLIHILVKVTLSNFHLVRDSEERAQLTHVYLALIKNESIDKEDRQIVLQALFSRADTGLLKEDSGPTMPNYVSGILNSFRPGSGR